ncbi:MAG TPA: nitroreductase family protein [Jatrophihabitans sp.]|nr:nitroreductase family protein [Jatrophihabitans sp.]
MYGLTDSEMGRAAARGTLAPSVHNTQPWRFVISRGRLELYADPQRQLRVLDPRGRQLMISCGCALFNVRVALAAAGYDAQMERLPDPTHPDLLARVSLPAESSRALPLAELDTAIEERRTNRRRFVDQRVPADVLRRLTDAAQQEAAELYSVTAPDQRLAVARLSRQADAIELTDPAYRAELRAWTTTDPHRGDGVLVTTVPHVDAGGSGDLPLRDFDTSGHGWLPVATNSGHDQCLLLLGTLDDDRMSWLRAGEALQRVWLELTRLGYVASLFTQLIEVRQTHELLRHELGLGIHPHLLMRVGQAPDTPPAPRRPAAEVITDNSTVNGTSR